MNEIKRLCASYQLSLRSDRRETLAMSFMHPVITARSINTFAKTHNRTLSFGSFIMLFVLTMTDSFQVLGDRTLLFQRTLEERDHELAGAASTEQGQFQINGRRYHGLDSRDERISIVSNPWKNQ